MELDELKSVWQSIDQKVERSLMLQEQQLEQMQSRKAASRLTGLFRQRVVECVFHGAAIVLLLLFLRNNLNETPYALSALALLAFYSTTLFNALKQIRLIRTIDLSSDLATMQSSLMKLQAHIVSYAKMTLLFIPTFLAYPTVITKVIKDYDLDFFSSFDIIAKSNGSWLTVQFWVFVVLVPLGLWFYNEVSYRNINKSWVRKFIEKSSGRRVASALEFLNELQGMRRGVSSQA